MSAVDPVETKRVSGTATGLAVGMIAPTFGPAGLIPTLPGNKACVWTGPPLLAKTGSNHSPVWSKRSVG